MKWVRFAPAAGWVLLLFLTGCAKKDTHSAIFQDGLTPDARAAPEEVQSLDSDASAAVPDDSLALVEHVTAEALPLPEGEVLFWEQPVMVAEESRAEQTSGDKLSSKPNSPTRSSLQSPEAPFFSSLLEALLRSVRFEGVWGSRSDIKGILRFPHKFALGLRTGITHLVGYFCFESPGPVERIAAGNLRARFGENLVLGRRDPNSSPTCSGNKPGEFHVTPSLSRWERTDAAALMIRAGRVRTGALVWERYEAEARDRQRECWLTLSFAQKGWWAGAATGFALCRDQRDGGTRCPPGAVTVAVRKQKSKTGRLTRESSRVGLSGECAFLGKNCFFSLGASARGRCNGWIRFFKQPAPRGFGGGVNGLLEAKKTLLGGVFRWNVNLGPARAAFSLHDGAIRGESQSTHYRRCTVYFSGRRRRGHRWRLSTAFIERRKTAFISDMQGFDGEEDKWNEGRLCARWDFDPDPFFSHYLRADFRLNGDGRFEGVLLTSGARFSLEWIEAVWRVTNYSLADGRNGFISRPGVGPFEYLTAVYRDGSDVSLRVRFKAFSPLEILGYYGKPWEKKKRLYIGIRWTGDGRS